MKLYAEISKTESQDDGTIKVWGYASSEAVDSDGETVTAEAMKAAIPDYMKWGAVREMHQPSAAGTAIECRVEDDGRTLFGAHIVDSEAVKKVQANVYKGFSIGGKVTSRDELNKSIIKGLKLVEISLVDRPANPEAVITVCKIDGDADQEPAVDALADLLNKGAISAERLLELAKADLPAEEDLKKGLYTVTRLADVLDSLASICASSEWESQSEGDSSPIPQALRDWLKEGAKILQDMAAEEVAEMVSELQSLAQQSAARDLALADKTGDLAKAGAKFSAAARDKLAKAHQAIREAGDHLASTGYDKDCDDEDGSKAEAAADLAKVAGELDLAKAEAVKIAAERDALQKRVQELEALPAPGKAFLRAVAKGEDAGAEDEPASKVAPVIDHRGDINEAATLIKMIRAGAPVVK